MERNYVNKEALNIDGRALEAAMNAYQADKSPQNMAVFVQALLNSRYLVPTEFPKNLGKEVIEKLKNKEKVTPEELPRMLPILMTNKNQERFAPAFTSKEQIPDNHNFMALMPVPVTEVLRVAGTAEYKIKGILLNPNSTKMILGQSMIKLLNRVVKGEPIEKVMEEMGFGKVGKQKITMTIEQFHVFARKNVEIGILPKIVFQNKAKFLEIIEDKKESMLLELYKGMYKANVPFPYEENDFDIMALEIRDDLTIISIGLPTKNAGAGACTSVYVAWNPQTETAQYYTIEVSKDDEPAKLGQVTEDGKYKILGEAPAQGSEMFAIIEMADKQ